MGSGQPVSPPCWTGRPCRRTSAIISKSRHAANIFDDPRQRDRKHWQAVMDEMSLVISSMKGIERASVLIDSQPQSGGIGLAPLKTASVFASAIGSVPLDDDQVDKICCFVAGGVAGMNPENVTIADANGPVRIGISHKDSPDSDPYARAVRKAEQDLNAKIRESLAYIPNLTVTSTVVLDHEKGTRTVENKFDPKPVPVKTREDSRTMSHESNSRRWRSGVANPGRRRQSCPRISAPRAARATRRAKNRRASSQRQLALRSPRRKPTDWRRSRPRSPSASRQATLKRSGASGTR